MNLDDISIFRMLTGKTHWLSARQRVLAQNIANADTPRYRPNDLKPVDFTKAAGADDFRVALARTHPAHVTGTQPVDGYRSLPQGKTYETLPAGNAVVLEEQLVKVAENRHQFDLMSQLYRKHVQLFRIALGRHGQ